MKMEMFPIEVYVSEAGLVCLKQSGYPDEDDVICIHRSQVETVAEWMNLAKVDALNAKFEDSVESRDDS